jgi:two-component system, LytTR family, sensor kinase
LFDVRPQPGEPAADGSKQRARRLLIIYAICFAAWAVIGVMYVSRDVARRLYWDIPAVWQEVGFWSVRVIISAALTPVILWLGRRWPLERRTWPRRVGLHLLFGAGFAIVVAACLIAVFMPLNAALDLGMKWTESIDEAIAVMMISGFHENVLAYWVILSVQTAYRYHEKYQERAREALKLELHASKLELHASELRAQVVQAQLGALKTQLQPHFLFNTLNAIVALVRQHKGLLAEEALTRFSDLLRAVLDDRDAQEVPLNRELEYVRLYLSIEQMRFSDRLRANVSADPDVLTAAVPHLGLQPLVENALRHGIAHRAAGGEISVRACRRQEMLHITIINDVATASLIRTQGGFGMGIANLRARLLQLYGGQAELRTAFADVGQSSVTLILPYRRLSSTADNELLLGEFVNERAG